MTGTKNVTVPPPPALLKKENKKREKNTRWRAVKNEKSTQV